MKAVIMAGGLGARLRPLTYAIPKPLLPVGDKPILEILLGLMKRAGLTNAIVSTGYRGELISSYFGNGERLGLQIDYVHEEEPLGTAGALRLVRDRFEEPFLVVNADILTRLDFAALLRFHNANAAMLTAGVVQHETEIPYGVVQGSGDQIHDILEKPVETRQILAGIYALSPAVFECLHDSGRMDMPQLIQAVRQRGGDVYRYEISEFWLDVGAMQDFEAAREAVESWGDV
jgi:NDP-sugar pyrophosphorylase family protein